MRRPRPRPKVDEPRRSGDEATGNGGEQTASGGKQTTGGSDTRARLTAAGMLREGAVTPFEP